MEKETPADKKRLTVRGLLKGAAYLATTGLAYIGLVTLVAPLKQDADRRAETITNIADAELTPREREALDVCRTKSAKPDFIGSANAINLTGEYGIPLKYTNGLDDNCQAFTIRYTENWQAMIGRHEMQMSHNYYAGNFQSYVSQVKNALSETFHDIEPDYTNPQHRFLVLKIVNETVNRDFEYQSDQRLFNESDHFATTVEALDKSNGGWRLAGDCDDYAATKFLVLRELGFPSDQMFAAVVGPKDEKNINHMVLMVNQQPLYNLRPSYLVLDNNTSEASVMRTAQEAGYRAYVAFNNQYSFIFPQALLDSQGIDLRQTAQEIVTSNLKNRAKLGWET